MTKRILTHVLFWIFYLIENSLFEYTWIGSFFPNSKQMDLIYQAVAMNFSFLLPKLLFTYYIIYYAIPKALKKNKNNSQLAIISILVLSVCLFLHRFGAVYILIHNTSFYSGEKVSYNNIYNVAQLFTSLLDLGFICGIAIAIKLFRMQLGNLRKEKDLTRQKLEAELKFLKNQLNPHFLFNALNNIYALARKKSDLAPAIIMKLAKLLRFMLYETEKTFIPIVDEIKVLEDYMEVEKVRFSQNLQVQFEQDVDNLNEHITPMILLPFVENAFKHGAGEMISESYITIHLTLLKGQLFFSVINSTEFSETETISEKIGLVNVRRQLELMYSDFKLETENLKHTFIVKLFINLNKNATI